MPTPRSLRRLVPDEALFERRLSGESLRTLAPDYGVSHTTLLRFFRRPEVTLELREARRRLVVKRAEEKARRVEERRLEEDVRKRAKEEAGHDRALEASSRAEGPRPTDEEWFDQRAAPHALISRKRYSAQDRTAAEVVTAGGGVEQVIEATGLRSRENVYRLVDAQIMARALANDVSRSKAASSELPRLRRLAPDEDLLRRRASGESLRELASDYGVCHTSLSRYFRRPEIAKRLQSEGAAQVKHARRSRPTPAKSQLTTSSSQAAETLAEIRLIRAEAQRIICPYHHRRPTISRTPVPATHGEGTLTLEFCCIQSRERFLRRVRKKLPQAEIQPAAV